MTGISLENRLAVHELIAEYSSRVDNYRGEAWADLFLEEGKLLGEGIALEGRQAFIGQAEKLRAGPTEYRHVITNVFLEPGATDDEAVANAYGSVFDCAFSPAVLSLFVEYRFRLRRQPQGWKIAEMHVHMPYGSAEDRP